jgi:outer membrane protein assembly factor BamB
VGDDMFGLDSGRLVCVDLATGAVRWKEGQYGSGQVLLAGDKILVAAETGQLACVAARSDEFEELWKIDVVKGKTWNHPALARGRLYYRNTTELVAFDLPGYTGKE